MNTIASQRSMNLPLGVANPKELGSSGTPLYECVGRTWSVAEFADKYSHLLDKFEQAIVDENRGRLTHIEIPEKLKVCLTRSVEFASTRTPTLIARRSGGRSAYWAAEKLKFKGCRPVSDGSDFPIEVLPFGAEKIKYERIPFGTMRPEGVMREILAYCFLKSNELPVHSIPICVYEYSLSGSGLGCCLVTKTKGEGRIEEFIEYPNCTVEHIMNAQASGQQGIGGCVIGSELSLRDIDFWWYVEQKSKFLSTMHFNGGFRGILNSNVGNDVLVRNGDGESRLYICDFDTFRVIPVPIQPDVSFLRAFVLQCMIEVAKGSLSILQYVDLHAARSHSRIAETLGNVYFNKSSLWHSYKRRFCYEARQHAWDISLVDKAFDEMSRTEAFASILCTCILNSHHAHTLSKRRCIFYPHN